MTKNRTKKILVLSLLGLIGLWGCGTKPPPHLTEASVKNAQTQDDLVQKLKKDGLLKGVQTSKLDADYTVVEKTDESMFFIKGGKVVASSRNPEGHEKSLLYWRHFLEGVPYEEKTLTDKNQREPEDLKQIHVESKGMGVVYDPKSNRVIRVVYFGEQK